MQFYENRKKVSYVAILQNITRVEEILANIGPLP